MLVLGVWLGVGAVVTGGRATVPCCLVLDVTLPGLTGLELQGLRSSYASLTPREREVMILVVSGLLNKQVGGELGISGITVKAHRGQMMRKMKADSLPDPVTMAVVDARRRTR
jgi:FixJ family two-component response regulator